MVSMQVRVTPTHRKYIQELVDNGEYTSISEAVRQAIRIFKESKEEKNVSH